ncbi:MAG: prepilin-type N-terminal cleavage/methylation domain-containing protein [Candidatus Binatia bacterium]
MNRASAGFSLTELLVAMLMMMLVMVAVVGAFTAQNRTHIQQAESVALEENLRMGVGTVADELRRAGYGLPPIFLSAWVPWVSGFTTNPRIVQGSGSNPDSLSVASCTASAVATLSANVAKDATSLTLSSTSGLNTTNRRLIRIGATENAHVKSVSGSSVTIDTDPGRSSNQGLSRGYPAGTPICRVDVVTFDVATDASTGVPALRLNRNQGAGTEPVVEGISDFQATTIESGRRYAITLTARSERNDPLLGSFLTRQMSTGVTLKN